MITENLLVMAWLVPLLLSSLFLFFPQLAWRTLPLRHCLLWLQWPYPLVQSLRCLFCSLVLVLASTLLAKGFFFTSLVWALAGVHSIGYVRKHRRSYGSLFLLAMAGNFGLILVQEMVGFYLFCTHELCLLWAGYS